VTIWLTPNYDVNYLVAMRKRAFEGQKGVKKGVLGRLKMISK